MNAFQLGNLDEEHAEIRGRYAELEKAILGRLGVPRMLEASNGLVQMILLHLTHEEEFIAKLPHFRLHQRHRDANVDVTVQLFAIEAGLQEGKTASVLQLLLLCRVWMKEHMHMESGEFECESLIEQKSPFLVRGQRVANLAAIRSPHTSSELNG
jgi:hemerythrin